MFVLLLSYIKPIDEVEALMREHVAWVEQHFDPGRSWSRDGAFRAPAA